MPLREINVDTLVSTISRRGHRLRRGIVLMRGEEERYLSENPHRISEVRTRDACMTDETVRHSLRHAIFQCIEIKGSTEGTI